MKNLIVFTLAILLSSNVFAQKKEQKNKYVAKLVGEWVEVCEISPEQEKALTAIFSDRQDELRQNRIDNKHDATKLEESTKIIRQKHWRKVAEVVGKANLEKMKKHRQKMENKK